MKKYVILTILSFFCFRGESAVIPSTSSVAFKMVQPGDPLQQFAALSLKEVQKLAGRKLTLKEKIAVKVFQWKIRKGLYPVGKEEEKKDKGKTAMIFGIVGLGALLIPIPVIGGLAAIVCTVLALVLGYQARKENPDDKKAKTAIILGWVTVGLFLLAVAIVIAVLASWGGWGWG